MLSAAITTAGATGLKAKVGASVWNWVTDLTGWGSDAKKKQALIDRVKQVIGKTLEDGVLRKEDEIKYEKILPTIGDPNDLVISKLKGLDTAIAQRRSTHLDALADAGYDVSRFLARPQRPAVGTSTDKPSAPGETRRQQAYSVGQILTVKGQKVRVTKLPPMARKGEAVRWDRRSSSVPRVDHRPRRNVSFRAEDIAPTPAPSIPPPPRPLRDTNGGRLDRRC